MENGLSSQDQETFLTRIRRFETDLDAFRRNDYETYIRPYRALWGLTLTEYSDGEQSIIRQFYAASRDIGVERRMKLQEFEVGGRRLVASFQAQLTERRRRLRLLDPEIDARLAFWGEGSTVASDRALAIHNSLYGRYGIQVREAVTVEIPAVELVE